MLETLGELPNQIVYGADNVVATAATASAGNLLAVKVTAEQLPKQSFVFDMIDGLASVRVAVPVGQVTAKGNVTYSDTGAAMYDVTITAYPDDSGVNAYKYTDDGITL
jgi:hypothetical protein